MCIEFWESGDVKTDLQQVNAKLLFLNKRLDEVEEQIGFMNNIIHGKSHSALEKDNYANLAGNVDSIFESMGNARDSLKSSIGAIDKIIAASVNNQKENT